MVRWNSHKMERLEASSPGHFMTLREVATICDLDRELGADFFKLVCGPVYPRLGSVEIQSISAQPMQARQNSMWPRGMTVMVTLQRRDSLDQVHENLKRRILEAATGSVKLLEFSLTSVLTLQPGASLAERLPGTDLGGANSWHS